MIRQETASGLDVVGQGTAWNSPESSQSADALDFSIECHYSCHMYTRMKRKSPSDRDRECVKPKEETNRFDAINLVGHTQQLLQPRLVARLVVHTTAW